MPGATSVTGGGSRRPSRGGAESGTTWTAERRCRMPRLRPSAASQEVTRHDTAGHQRVPQCLPVAPPVYPGRPSVIPQRNRLRRERPVRRAGAWPHVGGVRAPGNLGGAPGMPTGTCGNRGAASRGRRQPPPAAPASLTAAEELPLPAAARARCPAPRSSGRARP